MNIEKEIAASALEAVKKLYGAEVPEKMIQIQMNYWTTGDAISVEHIIHILHVCVKPVAIHVMRVPKVISWSQEKKKALSANPYQKMTFTMVQPTYMKTSVKRQKKFQKS